MSYLLLALFTCMTALAGYDCDPGNGATAVKFTGTKDNFSFQVKSPRGYSSMPQMEAGSSEMSLSLYKMQFEDLRSLGDSFQFIWKKEKCQTSPKDNRIFSCSGDSENLVGSNIRAVSLSSVIQKEIGVDSEQEVVRFRLLLATQGNFYFVSMPFATVRCQSSN